MQRQGVVRIEAVGVQKEVQLVRIGDLEDQLSRSGHGGEFIKFHFEGPPEKPGQQEGKLPALGDDAHQRIGEGICKQQHAEGHGLTAAALLGQLLADLRLGPAGKG